MAFTSEYLEMKKDSIQDDIKKIQYEIGGEWSDCEILTRGIDGEWRRILCDIPTSANGTITGIRGIDETGNVIFLEPQNTNKSLNAAFSFAFKFNVVNGSTGIERL